MKKTIVFNSEKDREHFLQNFSLLTKTVRERVVMERKDPDTRKVLQYIRLGYTIPGIQIVEVPDEAAGGEEVGPEEETVQPPKTIPAGMHQFPGETKENFWSRVQKKNEELKNTAKR